MSDVYFAPQPAWRARIKNWKGRKRWGVARWPRWDRHGGAPEGGALVETIVTASIAQLAEHALRKRMVVGSIPTGG